MSAARPVRPGPLAGVRVLDLTSVLMGPYCTQVLSDMGAEVIKLEPPAGDTSRHVPPMHAPAAGATFRWVNRGKRAIVVDLATPRGRDVCLRLAARCDVFVHSIRPQAIASLGLAYDAVRASNPSIVYCSLLGFGREGRYSGGAAYDDTIQALSGLAWLQSQLAGKPQYVATVAADKVCGITGAYAILGALFHRQRTGEGQEVDVPMFETMASFALVEHLTGAFYDPPESAPVYRRVISPERRPYATADGHLAVLVYNDKQWQRFARIAGRAELLDDARFASMTARAANIDAYYGTIAQILSTRTSGEWLDALGPAGIPVARVNSTEDLFSDPHLADVGFFDEHDDPLDGRVRMPGFTVRFRGSPTAPAAPAPALGQDTLAVLRESGFTAAEIDALVGERVVSAAPPAPGR